MPLIKILSDLASTLGIRLAVPSERAFLIERTNDIAKELYTENDLKYCEREQLFELGAQDQQVAFPQDVFKIIAVREYQTRLPITQLDMRPRYVYNQWRLPYIGFPYFRWRLKGVSPLKQDITDAGFLRITLPAGNPSLFTVIITGETANAKRIQEVVTFNPGGALTINTVNSWKNVESIRKSSTTDVDVYIYDINDVEMAVIPNGELFTEYKIVQVLDRNEYPTQSQVMEMLFKTRFVPFQNDYDQFPCGDIYDEAIYWKTLAKIYSQMDGKEEKVVMCDAKAENTMMKIAQNVDGPIEVNLKFGKNPIFNQFTKRGQSLVSAPRWITNYPANIR